MQGALSKVSNISIFLFYQTVFNYFFSPRVSRGGDFDGEVSKHLSMGVRFSGPYDAGSVVPIVKFYYHLSHSLTYKF